MRHYIFSDKSSERLDIHVQSLLTELSRSSVRKLIDSGMVTVNGQVEKAGYKLKTNDVIEISYTKDELSDIPDIDLPVIYEDKDCIVIDKPQGILTHSKGAFNAESTVATFIAPRLNDMSGDRAGIVHRLDRATSGVIICAKNTAAMSWLQKQFSQRKTKKTYIALISSGLSPKEAIIDMPIERDPKNPKQFRVGKGGKQAQTNYKIIKDDGKRAFLELKPVTGRTHQLRVHLKQLGYPIIGDSLYGGQPAKRLMLHAKELEITLPSKERKVFSAKIPPSFTAIIKP